MADDQIDINDILAAMPPLGQALFDAAHQKVRGNRLETRVESLEAEIAELRSHGPGEQ